MTKYIQCLISCAAVLELTFSAHAQAPTEWLYGHWQCTAYDFAKTEFYQEAVNRVPNLALNFREDGTLERFQDGARAGEAAWELKENQLILFPEGQAPETLTLVKLKKKELVLSKGEGESWQQYTFGRQKE